MMMLLALPQPGPPTRDPASRAEAARSWSIEPRLMPSKPDPPTRRIARGVTRGCSSHRSLPAGPGTMNIGNPPLNEVKERFVLRSLHVTLGRNDTAADEFNQW